MTGEAGSRLGLPGRGAAGSRSEPPNTRAVRARPTVPRCPPPPDPGHLALWARPGGSPCRQGQPCVHRRPSQARRPRQRAPATQPFPPPPSQTTCPTAREQNTPRSGSRGWLPTRLPAGPPCTELQGACVTPGLAPGLLPWGGGPARPGDSREPTEPWRAHSLRATDAGLARSNCTTNTRERVPPQSVRQVQGGGGPGAQAWGCLSRNQPRTPPLSRSRVARPAQACGGRVPGPQADMEARGPWGGPGQGREGEGHSCPTWPWPAEGPSLAPPSCPSWPPGVFLGFREPAAGPK